MDLAVESACPVCGAQALPLDVVDFNKSCEEPRGKFLPLSGVPIYYFLCDACGFCFAPEIHRWSKREFDQRIYNDGYVEIDPDYVDARPRGNAANLVQMFGERASRFLHLDYGGGSGLLSQLLNQAGWSSKSYDPFDNADTSIDSLGTFDLITAYEVFEHVADVKGLMATLHRLLNANGVVLFSTLVIDGNISRNQRVTWWYASPRNGHISLFSKQSLARLAGGRGMTFGSFSNNFHAMWTQIPDWASHVIRVGPST
jgi:SAM-dependent methyltransferase